MYAKVLKGENIFQATLIKNSLSWTHNIKNPTTFLHLHEILNAYSVEQFRYTEKNYSLCSISLDMNM